MTKSNISLTKASLAHFYGSEKFYRHHLVPNLVYTEGVRHVAVEGQAYWLIDDIALCQTFASLKKHPFQVWTLRVEENDGAVLICEDGNKNVLLGKQYNYTDFPLDEITLWVSNNTILLPSEW